MSAPDLELAQRELAELEEKKKQLKREMKQERERKKKLAAARASETRPSTSAEACIVKVLIDF